MSRSNKACSCRLRWKVSAGKQVVWYIPSHHEQQRPLPQSPGTGSALGLIALYFLLQIVLSVIVGLGASLITKQPRQAIMTLNVVIALPSAASAVLFFIYRLWPQLWSLSTPPGLGLCQSKAPGFYLVGIVFGLGFPVLGGLLTRWLSHGHLVLQNVTELGRHAGPILRIVLALVVSSIGPLVEEVLFRGVLLSALLRCLPVHLAVLGGTLLFNAVHLPGLYFQWYALPALMLLALALCWLRLTSGSLWPAVLAHSLNNTMVILPWLLNTSGLHS